MDSSIPPQATWSKLRRSVFLSALPLLACSRTAFALDPSLDIAQYAHTAWRVREGFGNGGVPLTIAQTTDGYIWLGGDLGLVRFDGVRSVVWEPPIGQRLPDQHILSLLGARDGTLWIGTWKGLARWKAGKLTSYPQLSGEAVIAMVEEHEDSLWVASRSFDPSGPAMLCTIRSNKTSCEATNGSIGLINSLHEDAKQQLWASASTGLWRLGPGTAEPRALDKPPHTGSQSFAEDGEGGLLIIVRGGIRRLIEGTGASNFVVLPEAQPRALLRDRDGAVWIATDNGLFHMHNGRTDTFGKSDGLSADSTVHMLEDREGSIWVTTGEGIDRFRNLAVPTISERQGLSSPLVGSILKSHDGSIWISTREGLDRWRNGEITVYRSREGGEQYAKSPSAPERSRVRAIDVPGLTSEEGSLFEDTKGRIWIATRASIGHLENDDQYVKLDGISPDYVDGITQDLTGDLWFAHRSMGLVHVSAGRMVEQIPWDRLSGYGTASRLAADPKERGLWLGFLLGGVAHFVDGDIRESYSAANGLAGGRVYDLRADRDGTLWIGTQGGLSRLKDGRIATLDRSSGLPCDSADWMVDDDVGAVWVYTTCGIAQIDRAELDRWALATDRGGSTTGRIRATVFDNSDGVLSLESPTSYSPHVARSSDGKVWFVTRGGVGVVDPHHLSKNTIPPLVHIEQIIVDHKIHEAWQALSLPPLFRDLEIDYTALSLVSPEKMQFRYWLEGHDRDWQNVGARRQAFYSDLPPGRYRFHVIASNNSGVWNQQGDVLDFSIAPAYWQTVWFRTSCVAVAVAFLWMLYRLRMRQLAREFDLKLEARVDERTRIARELHDTLLQSFQGLLLRFQAVAKRLPEGSERQKLSSAIADASQAVGEGRNAIEHLRPPTAEKDLASALRGIGEELAGQSGEGPTLAFEVDVHGTPRTLQPLVRDEIYRIAREALRNAFQHAQAHRIEVVVRYDKRRLVVSVRDDGRGIEPEVVARGGRSGHFGLRGMHERSRILGAHLDVWTELELGTEVELSIPASVAYASSRSRVRFPRLGWIPWKKATRRD